MLGPAQQQPASRPRPRPGSRAQAAGEDRYIGYYYPKPTSTEIFESTMQTIAGVERAQRIQFVTVVSQGTIQSAYRVPYAVFAKGEKADKHDHRRHAAGRARARSTACARCSPT